jgi:pimeloyl-ACP methyl ester carboxylesterase
MGLQPVSSGDVTRRGVAVDRLPLSGLLPRLSALKREAAVAALNGLLGDHLERLEHPLAMRMQLRCGGRRVDPDCPQAAVPAARGHVLVLVHGLCQSERSWRRDGRDPAVPLQRALGLTTLHVSFNSGLPVARSGEALARLLEQTLAAWPVPVQAVSIVGHGLGGLVARRAALAGGAPTWQAALRHLVCVATPQLGLSLDVAGHWLHRVLDLCPPGAPFDGLSRLRSAGIVDMTLGHRALSGAVDAPPDPLPRGVRTYALASTSGSPSLRGSRTGDGLVPLASALGDHRDGARAMGIPQARRWVVAGLHHLELMNHPGLLAPLQRWLRE